MKPYEFQTGTHTGDGNAKTITVGFSPKYFHLENATDRICEDKTDTMNATDYIHTVAAGTRTLVTDSAVLFNATGTVSIAAGTNINAKVYHWYALA
jgi:hypothetical protein